MNNFPTVSAELAMMASDLNTSAVEAAMEADLWAEISALNWDIGCAKEARAQSLESGDRKEAEGFRLHVEALISSAPDFPDP